MVENLLFVSCDIVGHSAKADVDAQFRHARAINGIVHESLASDDSGKHLWFSGGDGGHVAFAGASAPSAAIRLLIALRTWSVESHVPLRIAACSGPGQRFTGADGRTDMVGPGLNLVARLLQQAGANDRIVVTEEFRVRCQGVLEGECSFHEVRTLRGPFNPPLEVCLFSAPARFVSKWDASYTSGLGAEQDDRNELQRALGHKDGLSVLYRAKRLLQVNAADGDAIRALREFMGAEASRIGPSRILVQLFAESSIGQEFVRGAALVERKRGEILCRVGDDGRTMFLLLRGRLAGFLPSGETEASKPPDFEVGAGELVGEMAFALRTKRAATLLCTEDCSLLAFSQQDLFETAHTSPLLPQIKQVVDSIVRTRILQNLCRSAVYLSGPDRSGPLGDCERPWVDLGPFCRTISLDWRERNIRFDGSTFREPGLYVLAGGTLETRDGSLLQPAGLEPPILVAEFTGNVSYRQAPCRPLDEVTILFIGSAGFEQFGAGVHRRLTAEIAKRTAGVRHTNVGGPAVEGLLRIGGADAGTRAIDVVFVHGLDGDARSTWHPKNDPTLFWPSWLADDVPGIAVWSLGYEVSSSAWKGTTMPLTDRATNALATLETQGLGDRPIVFVCHSLGGLLVKQMLRQALDFGVGPWKAIATNTSGMIFLSTPHSGSDISNWMKHLGAVLRLTASVDELQAHAPGLRDLNTWFRNCPLSSRMGIQVYCEKQAVAGLLVVNESSADPGLPGVIPIPVDANHISICKPESRDKLVYSRVRKLVADICDGTSDRLTSMDH